MKLKITGIQGLMVFENDFHGDERGFFYESCNEKWFQNKLHFVQSNISYSKKGVLRGLHIQTEPFVQGKLVQVIQGEVFDVAIDLRKDSKTYKQWHAETLSGINHLMMYIPEGFAHGFLALTDSLFAYSCTNFYSLEHSKTIRWDDEDLGIIWPKNPTDLSKLDKDAMKFKDYEEEIR